MYMGLMQWDAAQPARELHCFLGFHVLYTGFKCYWCKVLEMQLNWDVILLPFMGIVAMLWLEKSPI